ncbi:hypothetical protein HDU96_008828 [Phlyctochytrium bullatum]|nr:hypothetical protein HDU96_008828 [Phlyctochytrium bullatum]
MPEQKEEKKLDIDEHLLSFTELEQRHKTSFNPQRPMESRGLTESDASQRLATNGPNILTPPKKKPAILLYIECLLNIFNALLILCGVMTYVLYGLDKVANSSNVYIGGILIGVSFVNAFIEFWQLLASEKILSGFLDLIPNRCQVIRDGKLNQAPAADLVLGDIVFVRLGDKVPADIYVIHASDFKVDNSSLTGEAEPQERVSNNSMQNPLEATNLAFNGTLAVSGEAYGVVIRTGDSTVLGQIAGLTNKEKKSASPLTQEINRFVAIIGTLAISSAVIFFIIQYAKTKNIGPSLNFAIGCLVAWVPQGLPATVTMLLTIAAKRMATQRVLVKDLKGVETLGAITLLATDKTGTLTRNQMTATNIWTGLKLYSASNITSNLKEGEAPFDFDAPGISEVLHISAMCTRARFEQTDVPIDKRTVNGDATESGLFRFAAQKLTDIDNVGDKYPKVFEIPFNSENKWHMTIHKKAHDNGPLTLYMKGAPERILRICSTILSAEGSIPLTDEHKAEFTKSYEYMAGMGHRVLAFAYLRLPGAEYPEDFQFTKDPKNYPTSGFCFVGLASLEDPPKHGVREAIGHCREAGVKIMMVTGDHPLTAEAIGRKINLMLTDTREKVAHKTNRRPEDVHENEFSAIVIHGEKIDELTDADWNNIFSKEEIIFARTSPKHKLQIVKRAQALGHIVGVTGDGVNDSPALKKADLGIAMNLSGSDVSKEAAAMILLDDNFASTVTGIKEGRLIFYNLKKSIQYVITHITPEVIPFFLNVLVPLPAMMSSLQILAVDLGFELFAALSYAWEVAESHNSLMKVPPRRPVNPDTIAELKQRVAEQEAEQAAAGMVEGEHNVVAKISYMVRSIFSPAAWKRAFRKPVGEILVDSNVLTYAYLEVGTIELIGCLVSFFLAMYFNNAPDGKQWKVSPYDIWQMQSNTEKAFVAGAANYTTVDGRVMEEKDQLEVLAIGQSAFYMALMFGQCFNLFASKCRTALPFSSYVLKNPKTFVSAVIGGLFAGLIVYVPKINDAFGTSGRLSPLFWLPGIGAGVMILVYVTLRQLVRRKLNPMAMIPDIDGLQMHPTRWSTGGK